MATAFNFIINFWRTIDENRSMTWRISDHHISIFIILTMEILICKNFLDILTPRRVVLA